ncbi:MAG: hypothetical protein K9W44_16350 [Candidatus Lokiarchaeota archaeon]|nr:hypothetical protein [Candidatus Harpocratesius repetitus]
MSKQTIYPHVYQCKRKIRGELRDVLVTRYSRSSETIRLLNHKSRKKKYRKIARAEARKAQAKRSTRAKLKDMSEQNKQVVKDERWLHSPDRYDYLEVDTLGRGGFAGKSRKAGLQQRYKKKKKKRTP